MENFSNQIKNIFLKSKTNKVYILGKGPSLLKIKTDNFDKGIVININDSERFYAGDIALIHTPWALKSVEENGFKAKAYISDKDLPVEVNSIKIPYLPDTYLSSEVLELSHHFNDLYISDYLFLTAIRLVYTCAVELKKNYEIIFLGFDFNTSLQENLIEDFSGHSQKFKDAVMTIQEDKFIRVKKEVEQFSNFISLIHVGKKTYSNYSVDRYNSFFSDKKIISKNNAELYLDIKEKIKNGSPVIVAELTNNHIGDADRLRAMIRLSKEAGADIIKVQKRDVETFYSVEELNRPYLSPFGKTLGDYRRGVELNDYLFDILIDECEQNEIFWFLSVLDRNSFEYILKYKLPLIKLPSTISNHRNYLKHVADSFDGDVVVSTGFTEIEYEDFVLNEFASKNRFVYLLQCTSSYPAPPESCNISVIRHYNEIKVKKFPNLIPGYSSHDVGALASQMAISAGALMIEKHVKYGNIDWIHFDSVALDLAKGELKDFVEEIERAVEICGEKRKKVHPNENHKYLPNNLSN